MTIVYLLAYLAIGLAWSALYIRAMARSSKRFTYSTPVEALIALCTFWPLALLMFSIYGFVDFVFSISTTKINKKLLKFFS